MPAVRTNNCIDFITATQDKKKKKSLWSDYNSIFNWPNVRVSLQFGIVICNTNFSEILFKSVENKHYSMEEFLSFYSKKLDDYIIENIEIDFLVTK